MEPPKFTWKDDEALRVESAKEKGYRTRKEAALTETDKNILILDITKSIEVIATKKALAAQDLHALSNAFTVDAGVRALINAGITENKTRVKYARNCIASMTKLLVEVDKKDTIASPPRNSSSSSDEYSSDELPGSLSPRTQRRIQEQANEAADAIKRKPFKVEGEIVDPLEHMRRAVAATRKDKPAHEEAGKDLPSDDECVIVSVTDKEGTVIIDGDDDTQRAAGPRPVNIKRERGAPA